MPRIRDYPEAGSLNPTDAFVIDREGMGTMFIDAQNMGQSVAVSDEGTLLTSAVTSINFVGDGVTATAVGAAVTVTVPGGSGSTLIAFRNGGEFG